MIDLHLHSYYSDGTMSPEELVLHAKRSGVGTIAITDHDGMDGLSEGIEAGRRYGVDVLSGIELSTEDEDTFYMHILGYCFDHENESLKNEVEIIRSKRVERNEKLLAALREIGCRLSSSERDRTMWVSRPSLSP